jgi:uncharacterized protein YndB with AHSA1/START domain
MTAPAEAPALVVRRLIRAPAERVFRAWSDPEVAARWGWGKAYDTISVELDCRPGGAWRHQIRDRNTGETFFFDGVFREVVTGRRVVHTFRWRSDRGYEQAESLVTVELVPKGADTEVVITHTQLVPERAAETRDGWTDCLEQIDRTVTAG